jgi:hypothetical protein
MEGASDGDIGVGGTGTVGLMAPDAPEADAGGAVAALVSLVAEATEAPLAPGGGFTSRLKPRISLRWPEGGALTTVGRRLRPIAASFAFCSGESA